MPQVSKRAAVPVQLVQLVEQAEQAEQVEPAEWVSPHDQGLR